MLLNSAIAQEKKTEGKSHIIYGIIGLFVIVAVWGLVAIIVKTFGVSTSPITTGVTGLQSCTWPQTYNSFSAAV